jgi:methionine synthase II (cobalamin-independent)
VGAVSIDLTNASPARWESVAATLEDGIDVYAGVLATDGTTRAVAARDAVLGGFERADLQARVLDRVVVTPTCGLAGLTSQGARDVLRTALDVARALSEKAEG